MSKVTTEGDRRSRLNRIQAIVQEDYERIQRTSDPFAVLNLTVGATGEEIQDRYNRYERFYRAENFQRIGDMDLTRKALEVRRAIGRAMIEIQTGSGRAETRRVKTLGNQQLSPQAPSIDPDSAAMAEIYFRDGLAYLRLGDFNAAADHLERATTYDPGTGIYLANLAYTRFKLNATSQEVVATTRDSLQRAAAMDPANAEVFVILARFGINTRDLVLAHHAIRTLGRLRPDHPRLRLLKKRSKFPV